MSRFSGFLRRRRNVVLFSLVAVAVLVGVFATATRTSEPDLPTVEVKKGEFVDTLEIRGDIKPFKSIVLTSPMQSGELQIVKLAKNGAMVNPGDLLVQFDGSTLQRTIQEKQSELRQSDAEIEQARAQSRLTEEQNATALMKSRYDIDRARLDVDRGDTVARIENDKAKLTLADSQQRLRELEEKIKSDRTSAEADVAAKSRKREKALFDLQRAERGLKNLELRAPGAGMVNILPNYRSGSMFGGGEQEFREGDRAWPGAAIVELPDLSSVHLEARLDESDRGRLKASQEAIVRIEAIPGATSRPHQRHLGARPRRLQLRVAADQELRAQPGSRGRRPEIRPGMSAVARIAVERVPDVLLVPAESVFQHDGAPVVYRLDGPAFKETPIQIQRRGREQSIVASGLDARRSHRAAPSPGGVDQEDRVKRRVLLVAIVVAILGAGAAIAIAVTRLPERGSAVPTARVSKEPLNLTVHAVGELRAGRTVTLVTPPVGPGALRIVNVIQTGMPVKKDDVGDGVRSGRSAVRARAGEVGSCRGRAGSREDGGRRRRAEGAGRRRAAHGEVRRAPRPSST